MSGVEGTSGVSVTPAIPSDLEAIYQGGDNFLARMQAMSNAKQASEKSLAALGLGKNIKAAKDAANADRESAAALKDEAARALAKAKEKAVEIVEAANTKSAEIVAKADSDAAGIVKDAEGIRAVAKEERATAAALKNEAKVAKDAAVREHASATEAMNKAITAVGAAEQAQARANAAEGRFNAKIAALHECINAASAL